MESRYKNKDRKEKYKKWEETHGKLGIGERNHNHKERKYKVTNKEKG